MAFLSGIKRRSSYRIAGDPNSLFDPITMLPKGGKKLPGEIGTDYHAASPYNPLPGHKKSSCKRCKTLIVPGERLCSVCWVQRKKELSAEAADLKRKSEEFLAAWDRRK